MLRSSEEPERLSEKAPAPTAPARKSTGELRSDPKLLKLLREGINAASDDDGWAALGGVGNHVAKQRPAFDSRNWGYAKLIDLVTVIGLFQVKRAAGQGVRVREKPKGQVAKKAATKKAATKKSAARTPQPSPGQVGGAMKLRGSALAGHAEEFATTLFAAATTNFATLAELE